MLNNTKYILSLAFLALLIGCLEGDKKPTQEKRSNFVYTTSLLGFPHVLQIENDSLNRSFIIRIIDTTSNYLEAINGCGDCFINLNDSTGLFVKRNFNNSNLPAFTIQAGIMASTYGAEYLFVIWQEQTWKTWNIYKVPFEKFEIRRNGNYDEIINLTPKYEEVYRFENGQLLKIK